MQVSMVPTVMEKSEFTDHKGCAVLIYSGDRAFLDYYRVMYNSLGFTPVTAATAEAARAILRLMVVTSVVVDAEEGLDRCREMIHHAWDKQQHAPVVVVARKLDQDFRTQVKALGAADYVHHPALAYEMVHSLLPGYEPPKELIAS